MGQAHQYFAKIAEDELVISYAGEWLLDNFYLIQQSLRQAHEDMPTSFYKKLPTLVRSTWADYPRVYALAHAIIDNTDANFNLQQIKNFVDSYQRVAPLTMGELWALPNHAADENAGGFSRYSDPTGGASGRVTADRCSSSALNIGYSSGNHCCELHYQSTDAQYARLENIL